MISRPLGAPPVAATPFSAPHTSRARPTAAPRPVRSRSSTTSLIPERSASDSTLVSTRRRIKMTLSEGRVTRSVSARAAAASRSTVGPMTIANSSTSPVRLRLSSSRLATTRLAEPVTERKRSALLALFSTMMGMGAHLRRLAEVTPGPGATRDLAVSSPKDSSP